MRNSAKPGAGPTARRCSPRSRTSSKPSGPTIYLPKSLTGNVDLLRAGELERAEDVRRQSGDGNRQQLGRERDPPLRHFKKRTGCYSAPRTSCCQNAVLCTVVQNCKEARHQPERIPQGCARAPVVHQGRRGCGNSPRSIGSQHVRLPHAPLTAVADKTVKDDIAYKRFFRGFDVGCKISGYMFFRKCNGNQIPVVPRVAAADHRSKDLKNRSA